MRREKCQETEEEKKYIVFFLLMKALSEVFLNDLNDDF